MPWERSLCPINVGLQNLTTFSSFVKAVSSVNVIARAPQLPAQFLLTRLCEVDDALQRDDLKLRRLRRRAGTLCPLPIWRFLLVIVEVAREVGMTDFTGRKI